MLFNLLINWLEWFHEFLDLSSPYCIVSLLLLWNYFFYCIIFSASNKFVVLDSGEEYTQWSPYMLVLLLHYLQLSCIISLVLMIVLFDGMQTALHFVIFLFSRYSCLPYISYPLTIPTMTPALLFLSLSLHLIFLYHLQDLSVMVAPLKIPSVY